MVRAPHEIVLETSQAVVRTVEQLQQTVAGLQTCLDSHSAKLQEVSQTLSLVTVTPALPAL